DSVQQFLLGDEPSGPLYQVEQDGKGFWGQCDVPGVAPEALIHRIQPERIEMMFFGRHRTVTPSSRANHDSGPHFPVFCTCQSGWKPIYRNRKTAMKNLSFTVAAFWVIAGLCRAQETLTLEQAVAMALDGNRSLRSSALEVQ